MTQWSTQAVWASVREVDGPDASSGSGAGASVGPGDQVPANPAGLGSVPAQ